MRVIQHRARITLLSFEHHGPRRGVKRASRHETSEKRRVSRYEFIRRDNFRIRRLVLRHAAGIEHVQRSGLRCGFCAALDHVRYEPVSCARSRQQEEHTAFAGNGFGRGGKSERLDPAVGRRVQHPSADIMHHGPQFIDGTHQHGVTSLGFQPRPRQQDRLVKCEMEVGQRQRWTAHIQGHRNVRSRCVVHRVRENCRGHRRVAEIENAIQEAERGGVRPQRRGDDDTELPAVQSRVEAAVLQSIRRRQNGHPRKAIRAPRLRQHGLVGERIRCHGVNGQATRWKAPHLDLDRWNPTLFKRELQRRHASPSREQYAQACNIHASRPITSEALFPPKASDIEMA